MPCRIIVGNNPINFVDPLGLWSFSIGAYYGIGGTLTIGRDSGKTFVMVEGGVGIGGKLKYKPFGKFPNVPNKESCGAGAFFGVSGSAGGYFGPLSLAWGGKYGLGVSKTGNKISTNLISQSNPDISVRSGLGLGLGIHGGVNVGILF